MTTEEKLQHFTMYAMEAARNKTNTMLREYRDALERFSRSIRRRKSARRIWRSRPRPCAWWDRITSSFRKHR